MGGARGLCGGACDEDNVMRCTHMVQSMDVEQNGKYDSSAGLPASLNVPGETDDGGSGA